MKILLIKLFLMVVLANLLISCGSLYSSQVVDGHSRRTVDTYFTPIPVNSVIIYEGTPPAPYKVLGTIEINNTLRLGIGSLLGIPHSQSSINTKLTSEAAKLGANGVTHINRGKKITTAEAILTYKK